MKFSALSKNSSAIDLHYSRGIVSCLFHDSETGGYFRIEIICPKNRSCFFSGMPGGFFECAQVSFDSLNSIFDTGNSGRYEFKKNSKPFDAAYNGSLIALGIKADKAPYLASIRTEIGLTFLAVPVAAESDIKLTTIGKTEFERVSKEIKQLSHYTLD